MEMIVDPKHTYGFYLIIIFYWILPTIHGWYEVWTRKLTPYQLVYRVVALVLTLLNSIPTMEQAFLFFFPFFFPEILSKRGFKTAKEDYFLNDYLIIYIEMEITAKILVYKNKLFSEFKIMSNFMIFDWSTVY